MSPDLIWQVGTQLIRSTIAIEVSHSKAEVRVPELRAAARAVPGRGSRPASVRRGQRAAGEVARMSSV